MMISWRPTATEEIVAAKNKADNAGHAMSFSINDLQVQVDAITNSVVRRAAQDLVNLASADGDQSFMDAIGTMFSLSARGQGTAIFYSGTGPNDIHNYYNAVAVRDQVLGGNGYLWNDTPLGQFIEASMTLRLESYGYIPQDASRFATNYVSARMAADADRAAIACVAGVLPQDYSSWLAQELPATAAGSGIPSFNGVPVDLVNIIAMADPVTASEMISRLYDCTTGQPIPDPEFAAAVLGLPAPEPGLESPFLPSLLLGGVLAGAGSVIVGGIRLAGSMTTATEGGYATTAAGNVLRFYGVAAGDGQSGGIADILAPQLSGLAAITSILDGTPLETFLPSAFWPTGGIDWDWSSVSMQPVNYAVPFATPDNSYTPVPGIVVSGNGGQFIGTFAQTDDGRPAISVTDTINGNTQTYMETAPGIAGVVLDTGSYTGSFALAAGSGGGALGAFLDPNAGIGQFGSFDIRDNATGEVVQDGIIVGGDGVDVLQGGSGNDTIITRDRDAATGEWQTTVTTAEQAALNQINQNLANYELAGSEIGQIFGSSLGQAMAGDNVFAQVASSTVLGTLLQNVGETWGRSVGTGQSLLDAAIGEGGAFNDFDAELGQNFQQQALGAVSGFLLGELAESLGFDGAEFGDQLVRASAGSLASTVMNNALAISQGSTTVDLFTGIDGNLATGIGISSFVGGYIAREIVAPETLRQQAANDDAPWPDVRDVA